MSDRYLDTVADAARSRLDPRVHRYFQQGAREGLAAAEASSAWDSLRLVPRVLRDVTRTEIATTLLGTEVGTPFAVAPTTLQCAADPEGEVAMARAAAAEGALVVVSSNAGRTFGDIGATGCQWWLQMYVTADRSTTTPVVELAVEAGARALVLTADTPVVARRYDGGESIWDHADPAWVRANFEGPPDHGAEKATDLGPQDVAWLARRFGLPVVVKGVLNAADARRCVDAGAAAVWVSNHGGRQLDQVVATADALGAVAAAVGEEAEVYVDGGVRKGTHALAAAALGARAVFLGRPPLFALADAGEDGVRRLLRELSEELHEALALSGYASLAAVDGGLLAAPRRV